MSVYGKNHYNIVISLQLIKINEKKRKKNFLMLLVSRKLYQRWEALLRKKFLQAVEFE